jgi:hypothetical protein
MRRKALVAIADFVAAVDRPHPRTRAPSTPADTFSRFSAELTKQLPIFADRSRKTLKIKTVSRR